MSDQAKVSGKSLEAKYRVRIAAGSEVIADEPPEKGGGDNGLTPY